MRWLTEVETVLDGLTRIDKHGFDIKTKCLPVFDLVVVSEDKIVSAITGF